MEGVADQLAGALGSGVGADRLGHAVLLAEGDALDVAVDAAAAGEDEATHAGDAGGFEQVSRALDIDPRVIGGLFDAGADARHRGKVKDGGGLDGGDELGDGIAVGDVDLLNVDLAGEA